MFPRPVVGDAIDPLPEYNFVFAPVPPDVPPLRAFPAVPDWFRLPIQQGRRQPPPRVGDAIDPPGGMVAYVGGPQIEELPAELNVFEGAQLPGNFGQFFRGNMPRGVRRFPMQGPPPPEQPRLMIEAEPPQAPIEGEAERDRQVDDNPLERGIGQRLNEAATVISRRLRGNHARGIVAGIRTRNMELADQQRQEQDAQRKRDEDARAAARRITQQQQEEQDRARARLMPAPPVFVTATAPTPSTPLGMGFQQMVTGPLNLERLEAKEQGVGLGQGAFFAADQRDVEVAEAQRKRERREQRESETPEERRQRKADKKALTKAAKEAKIAEIQAQIREQERQQSLIYNPNSPDKPPDKRRGTATPSFQVDQPVSGRVIASRNIDMSRRNRQASSGAGAGAGAVNRNVFDDQPSPSTNPSNLGRVSTPLPGFRGSLVDVSMSSSISGSLDSSVDSQRSNRSRPAVASPQELQDTISTLTNLEEEDVVPYGQPDSPF